MGVVATFLALCYGMLTFIGFYYYFMKDSIWRKIKRKETIISPEAVTPEAIMEGRVTASQLLNAGLITPSTLQTITSRASQIGPEYASSVGGGRSRMQTSKITNSKIASKIASKISSKIPSKVSSKAPSKMQEDAPKSKAEDTNKS